jgi:hypothetical protein
VHHITTREEDGLPNPDFSRATSVGDTVTMRIADQLERRGGARVRDRYVGGRRIFEIERTSYSEMRRAILNGATPLKPTRRIPRSQNEEAMATVSDEEPSTSVPTLRQQGRIR